MNSGLQCLLASPLVSSTLQSDINKKGLKNKCLALSYNKIIENRKRGKVTKDKLRNLKKYIATENERFKGNGQEDVAELISTLICGISKQKLIFPMYY